MNKRCRSVLVVSAIACVFVALVGSFVAPPIARAVKWVYQFPAPSSLPRAVELYRELEEPYGIRARRFFEMTFLMDRSGVKLTQSEALGYLGRADYVRTISPKTVVFGYKYDHLGKKDGIVNVVFDKGILRYCAYTGVENVSSQEFWDEVAKAEGVSQAPRTQPSKN